MMDSQTVFLRNIRESLGLNPDAERPTRLFPALFAKPDTSLILQGIRNRTAAQQDLLVETLKTSAGALSIKTHIVETYDAAATLIVDLVRTKNPEFTPSKHIIHHDHPDLQALQLWKCFPPEDGVTVHVTFGPDRQLREKTIASFIGITAPDIGVADSAAVIQLTKPGCPRSTSLVPSIHVIFLRKENLVANMREAYALLQEREKLDSMVFISGPSKTADIEAQMVHGAHGPREVHLILFSPQSAETATDDSTESTHSDGQQRNA